MTAVTAASEIRTLRSGLSRLGVSRVQAAAHLGVAPQTLSQYSLDPGKPGARNMPEDRVTALRGLLAERRRHFIEELRTQ